MSAFRFTASQILQQTELKPGPGFSGPRLFYLGCTERRRITLASQQIRAINLVHAITASHQASWKTLFPDDGYPGWRRHAVPSAFRIVKTQSDGPDPSTPDPGPMRVLIVGGGAGGLTAAAYAAFCGAHVTVVEHAHELIPNLLNSNRLLHPCLYEWGASQPFPKDGSTEYWSNDRAGLPLLDWKAGDAHEIRETLLREWENWRRLYRIDVRCGCVVDDLTHAGLASALRIPHHSFDYAILAVGFGDEKSVEGRATTGSYRAQDSLEKHDGPVLVCGSGDGALTDLFRATIRDFSQNELVSMLHRVDDEGRTLENKVLATEMEFDRPNRKRPSPAEICSAYMTLEAPTLDAYLKDRLNHKRRTVWLSVKPGSRQGQPIDYDDLLAGAFSGNAFPLNRLLLASLLRIGRHPVGQLQIVSPGPTDALPDIASGEDVLVIYRVGVEDQNPLERIAKRSADLEAGRTALAELTAGQDLTRQPLWAFFGEAGDAMARPTSKAMISAIGAEERQEYFEVLKKYSCKPASKGHSPALKAFESVHAFHAVIDAFDSVFQGEVAQGFEDKAAVEDYFRGLLRFYLMAFDQLYLTDTQVWDGRVLSRLILEMSKSPPDMELISAKLRIRCRAHPREVPEGFFFSGDRSPKEFFSSYLGSSITARHWAWITGANGTGWLDRNRASTAAESLLAFGRDENCSDMIAEFVESWRNVAEFVETTKIWRRWPHPAQTRHWNPSLQLEHPARFHNGLTDPARPILLKAFHDYRADARSARTKFLDAEIGKAQIARDRPLVEEIGQIADWFDRSYNRMTAKFHGANVFFGLQLGDSPGQTEMASTGGDTVKAGIAFTTLGALSSEDFGQLNTAWRDHRNKSEVSRKFLTPVNQEFWKELIEQCPQTGESDTNRLFDLSVQSSSAEAPGLVRARRKMQHFNTIDVVRLGWVGDVGAEGAARAVVNEDDCGKTENSGTIVRANPLGIGD